MNRLLVGIHGTPSKKPKAADVKCFLLWVPCIAVYKQMMRPMSTEIDKLHAIRIFLSKKIKQKTMKINSKHNKTETNKK